MFPRSDIGTMDVIWFFRGESGLSLCQFERHAWLEGVCVRKLLVSIPTFFSSDIPR